MNQRTISLSFILERHLPTWREIYMGINEGWIKPRDAIEIANFYLKEGSEDKDIIEMAGLLKVEGANFGEILERLASHEKNYNEDKTKLLWLRLILAWIYEHKEDYEDPLSIVEGLYADFGYPDEIRNLIRYNVPNDGYRPQNHSKEDNLKRLYNLWNQYIETHIPRKTSYRVDSLVR